MTLYNENIINSINNSNIKDKDKLIFVYYIKCENLSRQRVAQYYQEIKSYLDTNFDETIKWLVVPSDINKIEWLNKYDITDEQLESIKKREIQLDNYFKSMDDIPFENITNIP